MKGAAKVTTEDLLAAITAATAPFSPKADAGMTANELAVAWDVGKTTALRRIRRALAAGTLVTGQAQRTDTCGRRIGVVVYRPADTSR